MVVRLHRRLVSCKLFASEWRYWRNRLRIGHQSGTPNGAERSRDFGSAAQRQVAVRAVLNVDRYWTVACIMHFDKFVKCCGGVHEGKAAEGVG